MVSRYGSIACPTATDAERPRSAVSWARRVRHPCGRRWAGILVGRLVSMHPPWSIATSLTADPFFIVPPCRALPRAAAAFRPPGCADHHVGFRHRFGNRIFIGQARFHCPCSSIMWSSLRGSRSNAITRAPDRPRSGGRKPHRARPQYHYSRRRLPGVPPSRIPRPPELDRSRCAAIGAPSSACDLADRRQTGSCPSSC